METKRLIVAIVLSFVIIFVYYKFFVKPVPTVTPPRQSPSAATQPVREQPAERKQSSSIDMNALQEGEEKKPEKIEELLPPVSADVSDSSEKTVTVETPLYRAVITNKGVGLKSFVLKNYQDEAKKPLELVSRKCNQPGIYPPFYFSIYSKKEIKDLNSQLFLFQGENTFIFKDEDKQTIGFEYANKEKNISAQKAFTFYKNSYLIHTDFSIIYNRKAVVDIPVVFGPDLENIVEKDKSVTYPLKIAAFNGTEIRSTAFRTLKLFPTNDQSIQESRGSMSTGFFWAVYETKYFVIIGRADFRSELSYLMLRFSRDNAFEDYYYMIQRNPSLVYLGPKDEKILATVENQFPSANRVVDYGTFGAIAKILQKGLNLCYRIIPNYGWAIILLTLFLKVILFPLTYSSSISMAKMQTLQPKIKAIRKKYKNMRDPEQRRQMQVETMNLYKQEKVNPMGGCLPLLLQLPILWGFFRLLDVSISFRHQPWLLWIQDLSRKDPIYLLPIFMTLTQILIQRMTPSGADDTQKKMMYIMPVIMLLIFMNLSSGLNLYFAFSNILQIGQQKIINDRIYKKKKEEAKELKALRRKKGA